MSAFSHAFSSSDTGRSRFPNTYIVQDRQGKEEMMRLALQDQMITTAMGGTLTEQEEVKQFKRILDIGCGTGGWIIETARTYPTMFLVGIDINQKMVDYAQAQAEAEGISKRATFQVMDALALPGLVNGSFDLVNLRFGGSYLRTWDWPQILREITRVTRPGGTIRLTELEIIPDSNSAAFRQLAEMFLHALYAAHHFFKPDEIGIASHLQEFLAQQRCQHIQIQRYEMEYGTGADEASEVFCQNVIHLYHTIRPFIQKWGNLNKDYDILYQQMLTDMQQPGFQAKINFYTVWGRTPV